MDKESKKRGLSPVTTGLVTAAAATFLAAGGATAVPIRPVPKDAKDPAPMVDKKSDPKAIPDPAIEAAKKEVKQIIDTLETEQKKKSRALENEHEIENRIKDLGDNHYPTREKAHSALIQIGNRARDELKAALKNPKLNVDLERTRRIETILQKIAGWASTQLNSVNRLGELGAPAKDAAPILLTILREGNPELTPEDNIKLKTAVIRSFGNIRPEAEAVATELSKMLKHHDDGIRLAVAEELGKFGKNGNPALEGLVATLYDKNPAIRLTVIKSLGSIVAAKDQQTAVPALSHALKGRVVSGLSNALTDKEAGIVVQAADELGNIGPYVDKAAVRKLATVLKTSSSQYVKERIIIALGNIGPVAGDAAPELSAELSNIELTRITSTALGKIGPNAHKAVPALLKAAVSDDTYMRAHAIEALGFIGAEPERVVPVLAAALMDGVGFVRSDSAKALAKFGPRAGKAVDALITSATKDDASFVREYAYIALGSVGQKDKRVLPLLIAALDDKDSTIRAAAIDGLGNMGPAAKKSIPDLQKIVNDPNGDFWIQLHKDKAANAIKAINQKAQDGKADPADKQSRAEQMRNPEIAIHRRKQLDFQTTVMARQDIKPPTRG